MKLMFFTDGLFIYHSSGYIVAKLAHNNDGEDSPHANVLAAAPRLQQALERIRDLRDGLHGEEQCIAIEALEDL